MAAHAGQADVQTFRELPAPERHRFVGWGCRDAADPGCTNEKPFQVVDLEGLSWLRG